MTTTNTPLPSWPLITDEAVRDYLDLTSQAPEGSILHRLGNQQLMGAVELYNRLSERRITWICDEVGLGKTYVALAVAALFRLENPSARILYLLPSSRLIPKWQREINRFTKDCISTPHSTQLNLHLQNLQKQPIREPIISNIGQNQFCIVCVISPLTAS